MAFTIAVLSDVHFRPGMSHAVRRGEWGDVLLTRAVHRLKRYIKPDLVVLLGDCLDDPVSPDAPALLAELKRIMGLLACPWIAIPGNHDPAPDVFYGVFPLPADVVDVGPVRVLPFLDPEAPGYNATRREEDLARMRGARRDGFAGPVIAIQHVALYPPHLSGKLHHGYTNAAAVFNAARAGGIDLAIGGHSHTNTGIVRHGRLACLAVDALCEKPFGYTLVRIEGHGPDLEITSRNEFLAMPEDLGLVDCHSHTQFAYCSENMHAERSPKLGELMGLRGMVLTEHSGQLYFREDDYWPGKFGDKGFAAAVESESRVDDYFRAAHAVRSSRLRVGMEVDADYHGRLVIRPEHHARLDFVVGAVHFLPEASGKAPDPARFAAEFKAATQKLCTQGIHALAHPFRIFQRSKLTPSQELFDWLADHLKATGVAAEINFHTNEPEEAFFRRCIERGVPITFGSDAHNLYEVGEFYPHLALLHRIGVSDPSSVLREAPEGIA